MAEFLRARRDTLSRGGYSPGDIVEVREDGYQWSPAELPNVVKVPGLSLARAKRYVIADCEWYEVSTSALASGERDPTRHRAEDKVLWISRTDDYEDQKTRARPELRKRGERVETTKLEKQYAKARYRITDDGRIIDKTGLKADPGDASRL